MPLILSNTNGTGNFNLSNNNNSGSFILNSCSQIFFSHVGPIDPVFQFTDCFDNVITLTGVPSWNAVYCGRLNSATLISGDGIVNYLGVCTNASTNPRIIQLRHNSSNAQDSCTASLVTYYQEPTEYLEIGNHIYTDYSIDPFFYAPDGYYSDGTNVYVLGSGGEGYITSIESCI